MERLFSTEPEQSAIKGVQDKSWTPESLIIMILTIYSHNLTV